MIALTVIAIFAGGAVLVPCVILMLFAWATPSQRVGGFKITDER